MLIGDRYLENKLYRGIKHYDKIPLTSRDLHEETDTSHLKYQHLLNNLIGSGTLNEPKISISNTGVRLMSPTVVLIEGDISLVQSDDEILKLQDISDSGITEGVLCIVGWYQHLTTSSTLRSYGGVRNNIIENDILDPDLSIQVSTRYQLRWDTVIIPSSSIDSEEALTFNLLNRDDTGSLTTGSTSITTNSKVGNLRIASKPASMSYALSDLYILPIMKYSLGANSLYEFKVYSSLKVAGTGSAPKYSHDILIDTDTSEISDITYSLGIESYNEGDLLQISYNGVLLVEGLNYSINAREKSITLLDFTTRAGDIITIATGE